MKQFELFRLDTANECLWRSGSQIALAPKPFAVLRYLVENPGRLITHDELLDALWPETYVQPQVLRTYMLELRKVLGDDAGQPRYIQTLNKRGYCFVAPVTEIADHRSTWQTMPPPELREVKLPVLAGREEELSRLMAQMEFLSARQRRVAFVTGEAGIGKTALVEAFCKQVALLGAARMACGQCVEGFGPKEEYYPIMEALAQLCSSADSERVLHIFEKVAPAWLSALKRDVEAAASRTSKASAQERMPGDLCAALEELASDKPLILIIEDLNWADDATLHLLSALARRRAPAALMVLATYRLQGMPAEHPVKGLKQDLLLRRLCVEIALQPLPKTAVGQLLRRELKQEVLPSGLASFVHQHSEGNPLFAIAVVEHLIAQRFLVCEEVNGAAEWKQRAPFEQMDACVPDGLAQMIELEIDRLTQKEQRMLQAGSLISVAFPAWAVAAALEEDPTEIEEACDALSRRLYFLERAGQDELPDGSRSDFYVFTHSLYREVLYGRQSATCRARRHLRIANRLGELFSGREDSVAREMAFHYEAAGNWQRAVAALRNAARHAQQRQAFAEAENLLEHTLRIAENLDATECSVTAREIESELLLAREAKTE